MLNQKFVLTTEEIDYLGLKQGNDRNRYRLTTELQERLFEYRGLRDDKSDGIKDACDSMGVSVKDSDFMWLKNKSVSVRVKNPYYKKAEEKDAEDILGKFLENFSQKIEKVDLPTVDLPKKEVEQYGSFDRLVYTDTHVAMTPNKDGYSLYGGVWNEEQLMMRLNQMVAHVIRFQASDTLYIDDLGDFFDGFDAKTVRREHDLPQNMDNQKAFDVGFEFKRQMVDMLSRFYAKIVIHNVCESNHSSSFDYIVNSALKTYCEKVYGIEVHNFRKFIDSYSVGNYTFILTHGKDSKNLRFGFKPFLDAVQKEKISNYIDINGLHEPNVKIEFSKGDSHIWLFDGSSSDRFNYFNYPAFSPSSEWVQTNFKRGQSGCMFFNYREDGFSINPLMFDWN